MPVSYTPVYIEKFDQPEVGRSVLLPKQGALIEQMDPPETRIVLHREDYLDDYAEYEVNHEKIVKDRGRVGETRFTQYIRPAEFDAYYEAQENLLLLRTNVDTARDFIKTANDRLVSFKARAYEVDFPQLVERIDRISGAWFREIPDRFLSSLGIFGSNVNRSDQYKYYVKEGEVSSLMFDYSLDGQWTVLVGRFGNMVIYDKLNSRRVELKLVYSLFKDVVSPASILKDGGG